MTVVIGTYDFRLVALSVALATLASYAALDLAGRVASVRGRAQAIWLSAGAAAMGLGIWAMHYIAMLALAMPMPVSYHLPTVALSLFIAIAVPLAFTVVVHRELSRARGETLVDLVNIDESRRPIEAFSRTSFPGWGPTRL